MFQALSYWVFDFLVQFFLVLDSECTFVIPLSLGEFVITIEASLNLVVENHICDELQSVAHLLEVSEALFDVV